MAASMTATKLNSRHNQKYPPFLDDIAVALFFSSPSSSFPAQQIGVYCSEKCFSNFGFYLVLWMHEPWLVGITEINHMSWDEIIALVLEMMG